MSGAQPFNPEQLDKIDARIAAAIAAHEQRRLAQSTRMVPAVLGAGTSREIGIADRPGTAPGDYRAMGTVTAGSTAAVCGQKVRSIAALAVSHLEQETSCRSPNRKLGR